MIVTAGHFYSRESQDLLVSHIYPIRILEGNTSLFDTPGALVVIVTFYYRLHTVLYCSYRSSTYGSAL